MPAVKAAWATASTTLQAKGELMFKRASNSGINCDDVVIQGERLDYTKSVEIVKRKAGEQTDP